MASHRIPLRFTLSTFVLCTPLLLHAQQAQRIDRDLLVQDVRELQHLLETAHPDPYLRGGGKIAFHRRLQSALASIPEQGMTRDDFLRLVSAFMASVGDAHTNLHRDHSYDSRSPGGIPLYFEPVEDLLYVSAVADSAQHALLGAKLVSIHGLPLDELVRRARLLRGCDNEYTALNILGVGDQLWHREGLAELIPEWTDHAEIAVELCLPSGERIEERFELPVTIRYPLQGPDTLVSLPSTKRCDFAHGFLDPDRSTAILRIDSMVGYREDFELQGTSTSLQGLGRAWRRCHASAMPADPARAIAGIPSATEAFRSLVVDMKEAGSTALIVDLRRNGGGNSLMQDILVYFLFGKDALLWVKGRTATDVVKLSELYFENRPHASLEAVASALSFPIDADDYDFRYDCTDDLVKFEAIGVDGVIDSYLAMAPTFHEEYCSGAHAAHYCPEKIVVLCSSRTFSGGFTLMWALQEFGATVLGTPSAQAGNAFMDVLQFALPNSALEGQISSKQVAYFPGDPQRGTVLLPDVELTYELLAEYEFDRNASVLLAMDRLPELGQVDPLRHQGAPREPRTRRGS
jgi:hypothetical protein